MASRHGKGWRARWIDEHGQRQSATFPSKRLAEAYEHKQKSETREVRVGLRVGLAPDRTFDDLCDYWIAQRVPRKRSGHHDESIIRAHLRPAFGALLVRELGVMQVDRFVTERAKLSRKTIANLLTLLVAMLNVARDLGWIHALPRIRKPRVRVCETDFSYLRTRDEIRRLLAAAREHDERTYALYATAVLTGLRKGELAALRWDDVDFDRRLITVQRSYEGPTKSDEVRHVLIVDELLSVLRSWRLRCAGELVFPNQVGAMHEPAARIFRETMHAVLQRAGLPEIDRKGRRRPYITFHDLRHTFASHWVMNGGDLFKLQKLLGHKSVQMTMRYAHLAPHAFAADYDRFRGTLMEPRSVAVLPRRAPP